MSQYHYSETEPSDEYGTPKWVFDPLNEVFEFDLDAAATPENTLCDAYYGFIVNGLRESWEGFTVFNNPPFSEGQYGKWVQKASLEFLNNSVTTAQVLPFNPETKAFSGVWDSAHYLILPRKRIGFLDSDGKILSGNKFFSCVAIYTYHTLTEDEIETLLPVGRVLDLWTGLHQ